MIATSNQRYAANKAHRDLAECVKQIKDTHLKRICERALLDYSFQWGFGSQVDTPHKHHAYPGGLVVHTLEVMLNAVRMAWAGTYSLKPNEDVIRTAALLHDYQKRLDYDQFGKKTEYGKKIYHVAGSYAWFEEQAGREGMTWDLRLLVGHAMLAHHGRKEWGSPVEPQNVEAQILHFADMLSMAYGEGRDLV